MDFADYLDANGRPIQIGSHVTHPVHGKGRVEQDNSSGLTVRFDGAGVKLIAPNEIGKLVMESRPSPVIESLLRPMSPEDAWLRKWGEPGLRETTRDVREAVVRIEVSSTSDGRFRATPITEPGQPPIVGAEGKTKEEAISSLRRMLDRLPSNIPVVDKT